MASKEFVSGQDNEELKDNIQKGDPFLEKLLLEACCEISDKQLAEDLHQDTFNIVIERLRSLKKLNEKLTNLYTTAV